MNNSSEADTGFQIIIHDDTALNDTLMSGVFSVESKSTGNFLTSGGNSFYSESAVIFDKISETTVSGWMPAIILFCFMLYAWTQFFHYRRLNQVFKAFYALPFANQLSREGNFLRERISFPLYLISLMVISLFLFQFFTFSGLFPDNRQAELIFYLKLFAILFLLIILKQVALTLSGWLYKTGSITSEYRMNMMLFLFINGLVLLPVLIFTTYYPIGLFFWTGISLTCLIFILWLIRGISIGLRNRGFSVLHLFLYLCTFEIIPVAILIKLMLEVNGI